MAKSRRARRAVDGVQVDLVPPEATEHVIRNLNMFTQYSIEVSAYNIAGDGPRSILVVATTDEGRK